MYKKGVFTEYYCKSIIQEIIQGRINVQNISYEIEKLLYDKEYREKNIEDLGEVKKLLSDKVSSKEVAIEMLSE